MGEAWRTNLTQMQMQAQQQQQQMWRPLACGWLEGGDCHNLVAQHRDNTMIRFDPGK